MDQPGNIKQILASTDKGVTRTDNVLTRLFRTILLDCNIGPRLFDNLVKQYLHDPNSGIDDNPTARNNHRGNLMKELATDNMTWRAFMKALHVLRVGKFELILNIERKGVITQHVVFVENAIGDATPKEDLSNAKVVDEFVSDKLRVNESTANDNLSSKLSSADDILAKTGKQIPGLTSKKK